MTYLSSVRLRVIIIVTTPPDLDDRIATRIPGIVPYLRSESSLFGCGRAFVGICVYGNPIATATVAQKHPLPVDVDVAVSVSRTP